MNPRPPGYEPDELPGCSTPRPLKSCYKYSFFMPNVKRDGRLFKKVPPTLSCRAPVFCHRMFRLISLTLKLGYNIQDMRRERRKDSTNVLSLVLRDRSACFGLSFPFLNLNQNIRLKSLHHNHDDRLQEALSHVKSLNLTRREKL